MRPDRWSPKFTLRPRPGRRPHRRARSGRPPGGVRSPAGLSLARGSGHGMTRQPGAQAEQALAYEREQAALRQQVASSCSSRKARRVDAEAFATLDEDEVRQVRGPRSARRRDSGRRGWFAEILRRPRRRAEHDEPERALAAGGRDRRVPAPACARALIAALDGAGRPRDGLSGGFSLARKARTSILRSAASQRHRRKTHQGAVAPRA